MSLTQKLGKRGRFAKVSTDNPLILLVPEPGIEPGWAQGPEDFETDKVEILIICKIKGFRFIL